MYTYKSHRATFDAIALRGMQQELSWDTAAEQYEGVTCDAKYQW
jgi:glycogen synthase